MKFILGKKIAMTQVFDEAGEVHPVTVIQAGPNIVTQVKAKDKEGYSSVQVGFDAQKSEKTRKSLKGHVKELGGFKFIKEFRFDDSAHAHKVGDKIDVSAFTSGESIVVSSVSKGKGFQGVVKRHGFGGGRRTHGQKHSEREPGTIGGGLRTRVPSGMRMAGRMGGDRVTVKNLRVVQINPEENLLLVSGAIAGKRGTLVEVRTQG
jgi:large subunit ribosomal protein L3